MSKFNFSFRRSERRAFKHIAHGLIPAATIAPRPAVPRTPPPRSPNPSPERPRSALAAAILSSSLTGRTVAIPPARPRSYSESDCSRSEHPDDFQPFASTALYTRDSWSDVPLASRPRCPSPGRFRDDDDDEDDDDEEDEGLEEEVLSEDGHVYQSVENPARSPQQDPIYAVPLKLRASQSDGDELTEDSTFDIVSPLHTEEELEEEPIAKQRRSSPPHTLLSTPRRSSPKQPRTPSPTHTNTHTSTHTSRQSSRRTASSPKAMPSPGVRVERAEVMDVSRKQQQKTSRTDPSDAYREAVEVQRELVRALQEQRRSRGEKEKDRDEREKEEKKEKREQEALRRRCEEQQHLLVETQQRLLTLERQLHLSTAQSEHTTHTGETAELQSLRQQAQELVDENDALKMTVHRLNIELSHYQTRFRPLSKEESARTSGLPGKGPCPPWLLDMKYLSPLLLAYEDRLMEKDTLLQACQEEVRKLRVQAEEVVKENERLHEQISRAGAIGHKEWKQLQEQARLVLEENQVLLEQLETQQSKAKENQNRHHQEVAKVSKQLVLQEEGLLVLQRELEDARRQLHTHQQQDTHTRQQHQSDISQLTRRAEEEEVRWRGELDELLGKMAVLQTEKKNLLRDNSQLHSATKSLEGELERSRHAHRKCQRGVEGLKQQLEESMDKELTALHYLSGVLGLAEKTTQERDQLIHMASALEKDKQDVLTRIIKGTVQLAKLQEKVKVYKREAVSSVSGLGRRLAEQEEAFAGRTESFLRERQHLTRLLRDKQHALDGALQQKREVESELEAVWESVSRESQRIRDNALESPASGMLLVAASDVAPSADWSPARGSPRDPLTSPRDPVTFSPLPLADSPQRPSPLHTLEFYS